MTDHYQETVEHMLGRLTGEIRAARIELDQLHEDLGDLREGLHREQQNRSEALIEIWNSIHEMGGRR